ncbi:MAG: sulfur carrier protein ThiS [Acidimicrobiales bacterium]
MKIVLNGHPHEVPEGTTVAALVAGLARTPRGVAVALNEEVVPRSTWSETSLCAGDRVEVLGAAQGG